MIGQFIKGKHVALSLLTLSLSLTLPSHANTTSTCELTLAGSYDTPHFAHEAAIVGNYAYVTDDGSGLQVLDISDPTNPTFVGSYNTPNRAIGVVVDGNYAYVGDYTSLQVIDISDPTNPTLAGSHGTTVHNYFPSIAGGYVFLPDGESGLSVFDVSDPTNPVYAGGYNTPGSALDVALDGDYAYVADTGGGLQVLDISDPTNPTFVAMASTPGLCVGIVVSGNLAYAADAVGGFQVFDISDPTNPTIVGGYLTAEQTRQLAVDGDFVYLATGGIGVLVLDVSDPTNPTLVASYDTPALALAVTVEGEYLYVGDYTAGLQVLRIEGCGQLTIGSVAGYVTANCPEPGAGFIGVEIDAYQNGNGDLLGSDLTDADGYYQIDNLEAGEYTITIVTPLSYVAEPDEVLTTVVAGEVAPADFVLDCLDITPSQRSIGFWKHQVGVATGGNGNAQIDGTTLCDYLNLIELHFNNSTVNEVKVYIPPASGLCDDKLEEAKELLNLKGNVAMTDRAKQQLMALLLNVSAEKLSLREVISVDGANVSQAITYCDNLIDDPAGDHEKAKTICDWINNAREVAADMIPLGTPDIAYSPPRGDGSLPETFVLGQNYPNPFNPSTVIHYDVPVGGGVVKLQVFDVSGRLVRTLVDGAQAAGTRTAAWDGTDARGRSVSTGIYFYRLEAKGLSHTKKMLLVK